MCPSGATFLSADYCFSELAKKKPKADIIIISLKINMFFCNDIAEKLLS